MATSPRRRGPSPTASSPGSSTRSATSSRSRARSSSRPSPTTGPPTRSRAPRSTSARRTRSGERRPIPGVGKAIADKIAEMATTGHMAMYERLRAEIPPTLVDLLRIPGVGPQTVRIVWESLGIADLTTLKEAAQAGRLRELKGISTSTEERILEGIEKLETAPRRLLIHRAQAASDDLVEQLRGVPGRDPDRPGGLAPPPQGVDRRPRPARRDGGREDGRRAVHPPRLRRPGPGRRAGQGRRHGASWAAGRPHGHAARRGRDVPHPLHGLGGPQHPAARHRARPGLEPVREGLPPDRRGGPPADRRGRRAAHVRGRGGRLRVPRPRVHRARAARGPGRDRGGARAAAADAHHPRRPARRPPQPLRLERRRPLDRGHGRGGPAASATPTRCSPTTRRASPSPAA